MADMKMMYQVGQVIGAVSAKLDAKVTTPPPRYTEATLLDEMNNVHKYAKNDAERKILKEINGLGTSRTKVETISALIRRGLFHVVKKGKNHEISPDEMAIKTVSKLPPLLLDVATTARWEKAFTMVERGEVSWQQVVERQHGVVAQVIEHARAQKQGVQGAQGAGSARVVK